jgi:Secretion system C-terminal sorting domain
MKKLIATPFFFLWAFFLYAQTIDTLQVGRNEFAISGNTYSPFQTLELSNTWNQSVYVYPRQAMRGAAKNGKLLKGFQLFRDISRIVTAQKEQGYFASNTATIGRIYVANTTLDDWSTIFSWDSVLLVTRATLVFEGDIKAIAGTKTGWRTFPFSTPFSYDTTKNLALMFQYQQNNGTVGQMYWAYDSTHVKATDADQTNYYSRYQLKYNHKSFSQTTEPVNNFTGSNVRHPTMRFLFAPQNVQVGVAEGAVIAEVLISPNPATDVLNFDCVAREKILVKMLISDLLGRTFQQKNVDILRGSNNVKIPISDLPKGIYLLTIDDGKVVVKQKFVKM